MIVRRSTDDNKSGSSGNREKPQRHPSGRIFRVGSIVQPSYKPAACAPTSWASERKVQGRRRPAIASNLPASDTQPPPKRSPASPELRVYTAHFQLVSFLIGLIGFVSNWVHFYLGSFLIGLVSNWAQL